MSETIVEASVEVEQVAEEIPILFMHEAQAHYVMSALRSLRRWRRPVEVRVGERLVDGSVAVVRVPPPGTPDRSPRPDR